MEALCIMEPKMNPNPPRTPSRNRPAQERPARITDSDPSQSRRPRRLRRWSVADLIADAFARQPAGRLGD
jgi:hypothetical protein